MGFLRRLFGGGAPKMVQIDAWMMKPARADATVEVVGESFHQHALLRLSGGRTPDGPAEREQLAILFPEPENQHDRNAISARIDGRPVGYLPRELAAAYQPVVRYAASKGRKIACDAELIGGWDDGRGSKGSFGVVLHLGSPMESMLDCIEDTEDDVRVRQDHQWAGQLMAFTGDPQCTLAGMAIDRPAAELLAKRAGLSVHPRVTKQVQLLVDCDPTSTSGNERKALDYGIPVVLERDFWAEIGVPVTATSGRSSTASAPRMG